MPAGTNRHARSSAEVRRIVTRELFRPEGTSYRELAAALGWPAVHIATQAKRAGLRVRIEGEYGNKRFFGVKPHITVRTAEVEQQPAEIESKVDLSEAPKLTWTGNSAVGPNGERYFISRVKKGLWKAYAGPNLSEELKGAYSPKELAVFKALRQHDSMVSNDLIPVVYPPGTQRPFHAVITINGFVKSLGKKLKLNDEDFRLQRKRRRPGITMVNRIVEVKPRSDSRHGRAYYAAKITAAIGKTVEGFVEAGNWLKQAKRDLKHGEFGTMIENDLPCGWRTAERMMAIANDPIISDPSNWAKLPPHWRTLYDLTCVPRQIVEAALKDGRINSKMGAKDVAALLWPKPRESDAPPLITADDHYVRPHLDKQITGPPVGSLTNVRLHICSFPDHQMHGDAYDVAFYSDGSIMLYVNEKLIEGERFSFTLVDPPAQQPKPEYPASELRDRCLECIRENPSFTADQVAAALGENPMAVRPRISELHSLGLVTVSEGCGHNSTGKPAKRWKAVTE